MVARYIFFEIYRIFLNPFYLIYLLVLCFTTSVILLVMVNGATASGDEIYLQYLLGGVVSLIYVIFGHNSTAKLAADHQSGMLLYKISLPINIEMIIFIDIFINAVFTSLVAFVNLGLIDILYSFQLVSFANLTALFAIIITTISAYHSMGAVLLNNEYKGIIAAITSLITVFPVLLFTNNVISGIEIDKNIFFALTYGVISWIIHSFKGGFLLKAIV